MTSLKKSMESKSYAQAFGFGYDESNIIAPKKRMTPTKIPQLTRTEVPTAKGFGVISNIDDYE